MSRDKRTKFNVQIAEEAAEWFVEFRLGDIDAAGRRDFDKWIRSSPEHLHAYLETAAIWNEGGGLNAHGDLDSDALIALARAEGNVVPLDGESQREMPRARRRLSRRWLVTLAAGLVLFVLGGALIVFWQLGREPVYATTVGERRALRLEDGSTVELNSSSRIQVRYSGEQRQVELLEGQALFHVARNAHRPFIVSSDQLRVRAVGTRFDVNRRTSGTIVTVVEGRVAVYRSGTPESALLAAQPASEGKAERQVTSQVGLLTAGEQLTVRDATVLTQPAHASAASATAWTQGQLILDSATLADVAEEFGRYSARRLIVEDRGTTPLRLSGVFATDPDFLLRYLRQRRDITLEETATEVRIVRHE